MLLSLLSISKYQIRRYRHLCIYHNDLQPGYKTILFLHNLGSCSNHWKKILRHFNKKQHNIIIFDMVGHGMSFNPKREIAYSITQQVLDAQAILETYWPSRSPLILTGHGYGAIIAVLLARLYQKDIQRQILIMPSQLVTDDKHHSFRVLEQINDQFFHINRAFNQTWEIFNQSNNGTEQNGFLLPSSNVIRLFQKRYGHFFHFPVTPFQAETLLITSKKGINLSADANVNFYQTFLPNHTVKYIDFSERFSIFDHATGQLAHYMDNFIDRLNIKGFRNLVFEGGGIRGIAYGGICEALQSMGILQNIKRAAGASVGAIFATFVAVGYTGKQIRHIVETLDYASFLDAPSSNFFFNSTRLLYDYGWYKGETFMETFASLIEAKTNDPNITFAQLYERKGFDLKLVGTNINKSAPEIYSYSNTPEMSICHAVRISMSIPLMFKVMTRKDHKGEHILVDGGLSWNYPVEIFDYPDCVEKSQNYFNKHSFELDEPIFNHETLGFRLAPRKDPLKQKRYDDEYKSINHILDFGQEFIQLIQAATLNQHLDQHDWNRTVYVDTLNVNTTDFNIAQNDIQKLINEGKEGVYNHFKWRMSHQGMRFPQ